MGRYKDPEYKKKYYLANRERFLELMKKKRLENPEIIKARKREYYLRNRERIDRERKERESKNPEYMKKYFRDYYQRNKERFRAKRNAAHLALEKRIRIQTPPWVDRKKLKEIWANRPDGHEVDHIIPITHKLVCGLNVPCNLRYLPKRENRVKKNKFEPQVINF